MKQHEWMATTENFYSSWLEQLESAGWEIVSVLIIQKPIIPGQEKHYMANDPDRMAVVAKREKRPSPKGSDLSWRRLKNQWKHKRWLARQKK